jgi:hypothetical protein
MRMDRVIEGRISENGMAKKREIKCKKMEGGEM